MSPRSSGRERGAALVEFAIIAPVIILLLMGVLEFGFMWSSANQVERTVQTGARTGSGRGNERFADYDILRAVQSTISGADSLRIERVIVYKSTSADGTVPAECLAVPATGTGSKGVANVCNVYSAQQVNSDNAGWFSSPTVEQRTCTSGAWDASWCPTGRRRDLNSPEYLGVYVEAEYQGFTKLFPTNRDIRRHAVFQVEPCVAGALCV